MFLFRIVIWRLFVCRFATSLAEVAFRLVTVAVVIDVSR